MSTFVMLNELPESDSTIHEYWKWLYEAEVSGVVNDEKHPACSVLYSYSLLV